MNNNNDFASNTFTWVLEDHSNLNPQPPANKPPTPPQETFGLSDADLFQFLLGEEAQRAVVTENKSNNSLSPCIKMDEDFSGSDEGPSSSSMEEYVKKQKSHVPNTASSTSRLDFRPINDYIPESQLKAMTSKERRQLRNKISARNFRNRRKEYIGTLEDELNQQKAENSQLKLELKWVKAKMDRLQKENDKLRVDLVLGGIVLPTPQQSQQQQTSPYLLDSSTIINSTLNLTNSTSSSSDESNLSSPPNLFTDFPDNWDFVLPQQEQQPPQDTYLSHAIVPNWNINQVLSKETSVVPANNSQLLFQQYPLLAPALMSIVLTHTMTMSTDEILATAKLNSTSKPNNAMVPYSSDKTGLMTNKEAQAVWDILEPLTLLNDRNAKISAGAATVEEGGKNEQADKSTDDKKPTKNKYCEAYKALVLPYCPVSWLQQRVCRYLCEYVASYSDSTNKTETKFTPICRQFEKAKRYISPCQ